MSARPWWREPLVHVVVLGAAIFVALAAGWLSST
jgi:hypothetical protein